MGYGGGGGKILVAEATGSRSRRRPTVVAVVGYRRGRRWRRVFGVRDEIQGQGAAGSKPASQISSLATTTTDQVSMQEHVTAYLQLQQQRQRDELRD